MRQAKNSNYIKYKDIGIRISNGNFESSNIWDLLVTEGFWKLPISAEYGGANSGWEEFIQALEGFSSSYGDFNFLSLIISHACSIYLVLKCNDIKDRQLYLSNLIMGKSVFIYGEDKDWVDKKIINKSLVLAAGMFEKYLYSIVSSVIALNLINKLNTSISDYSSFKKVDLCTNKAAEAKLKNAQYMLRSYMNHII